MTKLPGKYVPAISTRIHHMNKMGSSITIPLKGVVIGDGWCEPILLMLNYGGFLFQAGLADEKDKVHLDSLFDSAAQLREAHNVTAAERVS